MERTTTLAAAKRTRQFFEGLFADASTAGLIYDRFGGDDWMLSGASDLGGTARLATTTFRPLLKATPEATPGKLAF